MTSETPKKPETPATPDTNQNTESPKTEQAVPSGASHFSSLGRNLGAMLTPAILNLAGSGIKHIQTHLEDHKERRSEEAAARALATESKTTAATADAGKTTGADEIVESMTVPPVSIAPGEPGVPAENHKHADSTAAPEAKTAPVTESPSGHAAASTETNAEKPPAESWTSWGTRHATTALSHPLTKHAGSFATSTAHKGLKANLPAHLASRVLLHQANRMKGCNSTIDAFLDHAAVIVHGDPEDGGQEEVQTGTKPRGWRWIKLVISFAFGVLATLGAVRFFKK